MKRKIAHTYSSTETEQATTCSPKFFSEIGRTNSGRTSVETILSPQSSAEQLAQRASYCKAFSPIQDGRFTPYPNRLRKEVETDSDYESEEDNLTTFLEKTFKQDTDSEENDYGHFYDPSKKVDHIRLGQPSLLKHKEKGETQLDQAHNECRLYAPIPRSAEKVFDFSTLLESLEETKPHKKHIT